MNKILKGFTYSYYRNIGWQDRSLRSAVGVFAILGAIWFYKTNLTIATLLIVLAAAQVLTVTTAKCIICYFAGACTITNAEKERLDQRGIPHS